jgi:hypothetical protein
MLKYEILAAGLFITAIFVASFAIGKTFQQEQKGEELPYVCVSTQPRTAICSKDPERIRDLLALLTHEVIIQENLM